MYRLRDSSGLVWPSMFPIRTDEMKLDQLQDAAGLLRGMARNLTGATDGIAESWAGLQAAYVSPEAPQVYALMRPAQAMAEQVDVRLRLAASAVDDYASELEGLQGRLDEVVGECEAFRASCEGGVMRDAASTTKGGWKDYVSATFDRAPGVDERKVLVPWDEDQDLVTRNEELIEEYSQVVADVTDAAARCANRVSGLPGLPLFFAPQLGGVSGVSPEMLVASWGSAATEDRSCVQATGAGVYNKFQPGLVDVAAHVGRDPQSKRWWSRDAAWAAWKGTVGGTANLAGSALVAANPVGGFLVLPTTAGRLSGRPEFGSWAPEWFQDRGDTLANVVGGILGGDPAQEDLWQPWRDDGGDRREAFGGALFNVATILLPTKAAMAKLARVDVPGARWAADARVRGIASVADLLGLRRPGNDVLTAGRAVENLNQAQTRLTTLERVPDNLHRPVSDDLFNRAPPPEPAVRPPSVDRNPPTVHDRAPVPATTRTDTTTGPHPTHPDPVKGRAADAVTTQRIEGLPRPSGSADGPGLGRGTSDPGSDHGRADGTGPSGSSPAGGGAGGSRPVSSWPDQWDGPTRPDGRPDVDQVEPRHQGDPEFDPARPDYDAQRRGEHGNIGTVDPDQPSASGLTNSGRLIDPDHVPEQLQPYIDQGIIVNDNGVLRLADDVELVFDRTNPNHDWDEFVRQAQLQERSLNQQSVGSWDANRSEFTRVDPATGQQVGRRDAAEQSAYRAEQVQLYADGLVRDHGLTPDAALARARSDLSDQDVLHGPDQSAGGNPVQFTGLGDGGVNRSLGNQWGGRSGNAARLERMMQDALGGLPPDLRGDVRMNVRLVTRDELSSSP